MLISNGAFSIIQGGSVFNRNILRAYSWGKNKTFFSINMCPKIHPLQATDIASCAKKTEILNCGYNYASNVWKIYKPLDHSIQSTVLQFKCQKENKVKGHGSRSILVCYFYILFSFTSDFLESN